MNRLTVVIITLNEAHNIADCISSAKLVSDDIVVVDCGSADSTIAIAEQLGAKVFNVEWQGYGFARNFGAGHGKYGWILSLDADERISPALVVSIKNLQPEAGRIYKFKRRNHIGNKQIRFGTLGFETVTRIYHRDHYEWDLATVHEKLTPASNPARIIKGHVDHFGLSSYEHHRQKARHYAQLSAEKYYSEGKRAGLVKRVSSAFFNSFKSYVIHLGFLDGRTGFKLAITTAYYSWLKYFYLGEMYKAEKSEAGFTHNMKTVSQQ
jgi:glycosyltransferase involved in cell wall biosynthesis